MCGRKSNRGLRAIVVSFVLLVLALQPVLAAWPFFFGERNQASPTQTDPAQSSAVEQKEQEIALLKQQLKVLDDQLSDSRKMLDTLSTNLERSGVRLNDTQATAESLLSEIENLKTFLQASEDSRKVLEIEYDALLAEYQVKSDEANQYYQEATEAVALYNAELTKDKDKKAITTTLGMAAVMKEGKYGIDISAGVNFGVVGVFGGAVYMFGQDDILQPGKLMYRAGLTFTF